MEMHQIRYFLMVSNTLNFTRAAEQCHVAQPSLTRAIKKLEDELGGELFHREGRRTHMTDLGHTMLPLLTQSYDGAIAAKKQAESFGKAEIAHLRLGLSNSIEVRILMPAIKELNRTLPELELQINRGTAEEIELSLEDGRIDVAITANDEHGWERINHWPLFSEDFIVAMSSEHHLSARNAIKLKDLADQSILRRTHCEQSQAFSSLLRERDITAKVAHDVTTESDLEILLGDNLGVGVVPKSIELAGNGIIKLPIKDAELKRSLVLLAVAGRKYSKPAELLIKLLRATDWSAYES